MPIIYISYKDYLIHPIRYLGACQPIGYIYFIYKETALDGTAIRGILARNIKSFREHRNWSQADLAEYSDISIPFLSEIERGNKWPYPDTLAKIANALDVKIHELFWEKTPLNEDQGFVAVLLMLNLPFFRQAYKVC